MKFWETCHKHHMSLLALSKMSHVLPTALSNIFTLNSDNWIRVNVWGGDTGDISVQPKDFDILTRWWSGSNLWPPGSKQMIYFNGKRNRCFRLMFYQVSYHSVPSVGPVLLGCFWTLGIHQNHLMIPTPPLTSLTFLYRISPRNIGLFIMKHLQFHHSNL